MATIDFHSHIHRSFVLYRKKSILRLQFRQFSHIIVYVIQTIRQSSRKAVTQTIGPYSIRQAPLIEYSGGGICVGKDGSQLQLQLCF